MAKKGNINQTHLVYEHMKTSINIKSSNVCRSCPYRMYVDNDEVVTLGTGNIHSNFIFILPTYDTIDKFGYSNLLSMLSMLYEEITGKNLFDDVYITRLVKCSKNNEHNIYNSAISPCSHYLTYELNRLTAKHVVFFGSAYEDYENTKDTVGMYIANKQVHKVYSPGILYYNNPNLKDKLIKDLTFILSHN